ncbi:hypothetical protein AB2B38_007895 [Balneola sp. MJW-20]|uniref:hypothetical protein n=1 Tax=Gracilimonas aurantiaca TaxID=3234185 RepID=UPI0034661C8E
MVRLTHVLLVLVIISGIYSCTSGQEEMGEMNDAPPVVEVQAIYKADTNEHLFVTDADTLDAGWTTFRFINASPMVHFMLIDKYPGDKTSVDAMKEVGPPFQEAMDLINEGKRDEGLAALAGLPAWFGEVAFKGGPGFTSPGQTMEMTMFLEPGNHVVECYVKTEDGVFHNMLGMTFDMYVTEDTTNAAEPSDPSLVIDLSNEGFKLNVNQVKAGEHLVAVNFNEPEPPMLANDVQVIKVEEDTDLDAVAAWMDWSMTDGLVSGMDDPAPAFFLGGVQDMPMGNTAYFKVTLEPGNYAWISERSAETPLYQEFSVVE